MFISRTIVEQMAAFFGQDSLAGAALRQASEIGSDCLFFLDSGAYFVMRRIQNV